MRKLIFWILAILGVIIIGVMSFEIPSNPYEIMPAMTVRSCDKPLWLCIMFGGSIMYLLILFIIYDYLEQKK